MGTVHVVKATLPGMLKRHSGDLVLFASLAGWLPSSRFGAYSATKFAVVAFGETLAHENAGSGVRFLCVCPPIVDTPLLEQVARRGRGDAGGHASDPSRGRARHARTGPRTRAVVQLPGTGDSSAVVDSPCATGDVVGSGRAGAREARRCRKSTSPSEMTAQTPMTIEGTTIS